jgi:uncharacterized membrane protein YphA (DoxX/SURF4 family)
MLTHHAMDNSNSNEIVKAVWTILKYTFVIVPVVAGLDKFTNLLTNWEQYLHPGIAAMLPAHTFMIIVGIIEIIAGIIVFVKPELGGYIVMAWLIGIALQLIASGKYFDIAVRDLSMSVGAYSLARLSGIVSWF